jgi:hypothetical protein
MPPDPDPSTPTPSATTSDNESLYRQLLGAAFDRLDPAVQRLHRLQGHIRVTGHFIAYAPQHPIARFLAKRFRVPLTQLSTQVSLHRESSPTREVWRPRVAGLSSRCELWLEEGCLWLRRGLTQLCYAIREEGGRVRLHLRQVRIAGMAWPTWLLPHIEAEEWGERGCVHFHFHVKLPRVGSLCHYQARLELPHTLT